MESENTALNNVSVHWPGQWTFRSSAYNVKGRDGRVVFHFTDMAAVESVRRAFGFVDNLTFSFSHCPGQAWLGGVYMQSAVECPEPGDYLLAAHFKLLPHADGTVPSAYPE